MELPSTKLIGGCRHVPYDFRSDTILRSAFNYWQAKCGGRVMPRRRDIDPTEVPRLLPNLQITELIDHGARIRYRLTGTAIVAAYGADLTGKHFDEVFAGRRLDYVTVNYHRVCTEKRPLLVCNPYVGAWNATLICTRLIMPLSDDDVNVNQCLTAMSFHFPNATSQWPREWFENKNYLDVANAYDVAELVRRDRQIARADIPRCEAWIVPLGILRPVRVGDRRQRSLDGRARANLGMMPG